MIWKKYHCPFVYFLFSVSHHRRLCDIDLYCGLVSSSSTALAAAVALAATVFGTTLILVAAVYNCSKLGQTATLLFMMEKTRVVVVVCVHCWCHCCRCPRGAIVVLLLFTKLLSSFWIRIIEAKLDHNYESEQDEQRTNQCHCGRERRTP